MAARWVVVSASHSRLLSFLEVRTHPEAEQVASVLLKSVKLQQFVPVVKCRILRMFVPALPLAWDFTLLGWVRRGRDLR